VPTNSPILTKYIPISLITPPFYLPISSCRSMDDHRSRKRRRHGRQAESTPRYADAAERRKPAQPGDIGCDSPARRGGRGDAETRVRSHIEAPENGYVYDWLADVATEGLAQTHSSAGGRYNDWEFSQQFVRVLTLMFCRLSSDRFASDTGG
jgi:hypothetical protein